MLKSIVAVAALSLPFAGAAGAATLLNDTFSDMNRTNQELPDSAAWYYGTSGSGATLVATTEKLVSNTSSNVAITSYFTASGSPFTLTNNGDSITLSFKFSVTNPTTTASDSFRFGLYNSGASRVTTDVTTTNGSDSGYSAWRGYTFTTATGSIASNARVRERVNNNDIVVADAAHANLGSVAYSSDTIASGTTYDATLSLTKSATGVAYSANVAGLIINGTDTAVTPPFLSFDAVSFFGANMAGLTLDDISVVTVVPEPTATGLVLAAALLVGRRRRCGI